MGSENRNCLTCLYCNPVTSVSSLLWCKKFIAEFICRFSSDKEMKPDVLSFVCYLFPLSSSALWSFSIEFEDYA